MKIFTLLLLIVVFAACSSKEKVINPIDENRSFMISTDAGGFTIKGINLPSGNIHEQDYYRKFFAEDAKNKITAIADNGFDIFFFVPEEMKILVVGKSNMLMKAVIDFSPYGLKPVSITFANATDAYVLNQGSNDVSIVDLTVYEVARNIKCGINPVGISSYGNQVYIVDKTADLVHIIDTRTRAIEETIQVHPGPTFIRFTNDGKTSIVISSGVSGTEPNTTKNIALVTYIDVEKRTVSSTLDLGFGQMSALDQYPRGFEVTQTDWGFVQTQIGLFRLDLRNPEKIALMTRTAFDGIAYNRKDAELILFTSSDNSEISLADESLANITQTVMFPGKIFAIYPN
ncbi:MAG: hypothetical protein KGZ71_08940 [Desulfobulbaceae bacterium]|nr:hypothetical protein [Candidatus Kapabacteria bacterium]MBS4000594.1 hypothetical protein [Desulfobulbaceae bacterium]